eukprot:CAMPEP_0179274996 /NCGR_PEP_ID=MMETSP0797-20121207/33833_1 /TAXON_ID=47934 /ORGANISM="Dinophysis acuminata, Strain DAEP01" /LENGTH=86 /DNA_ID=CAMNT_0020983505 /DNA_START=103 /DNA_END=359 /DNA_ORIENTATION=+
MEDPVQAAVHCKFSLAVASTGEHPQVHMATRVAERAGQTWWAGGRGSLPRDRPRYAARRSAARFAIFSARRTSVDGAPAALLRGLP